MRVVVMVVAALLTLGLAAFGVTATQNGGGSASLLALAAHIVSPAQNANAPAPAQPAALAQTTPLRPVASPVVQVSDTPAPLPAATANAPIHFAENTAAAPQPAAAQAPAATPAKAAPTCANPNALGLSRTVEIDTTGGPGLRHRALQAI